MPRLARIIAIDYPHHIIQRGNNKQIVFLDDEDKYLYLNMLKKYSKECGCIIKAYCLMNNHIHILIVPKQKVSIAKSMQKISLIYTQYFNKKYNRTGRLWECRFHSCIIDKEAYLWTVCRYIERNPVRAKIVEKPVDYKWSSAKINASTTVCDNSFVDLVWKDLIDRNAYINFLNTPDNEKDLENIKKHTLNGKPLGTKEFFEKVSAKLGIIINTSIMGRPRKK